MLDNLKRVLDVGTFEQGELEPRYAFEDFNIYWNPAELKPLNKFELSFSFSIIRDIAPENNFRVIQLVTAVGWRVAVELPGDVSYVSKPKKYIKNWSMIAAEVDKERRQFFFILDEKGIKKGIEASEFSFSFPVIGPEKMGEGVENVWTFRFCGVDPDDGQPDLLGQDIKLEEIFPGWKYGDLPQGGAGALAVEDIYEAFASTKYSSGGLALLLACISAAIINYVTTISTNGI